jgi:hypothetical protein
MNLIDCHGFKIQVIGLKELKIEGTNLDRDFQRKIIGEIEIVDDLISNLTFVRTLKGVIGTGKNQILKNFEVKDLVSRISTEFIKKWGNRFKRIICNNTAELKDKLLIFSKYEARFIEPGYGYRKTIKRGLNIIQKQEFLMKGCWWLVVIRVWESRLGMHIETGTLMETIYQRATR